MTRETTTDADSALDRGQARDLEEAWQEVQPETARRLLIAAVEAFATRGYHATTTRDIARGAGMSPAGVYVHYRTKEELLHRITLIGHQQTGRLIRDAIAGSNEPVEQLRAVIRNLTAWQARFHTTARVVEYELHFLTGERYSEIAGLRREIERLMRKVLQDGVDQGFFEVPDIRATALALMSLAVDVVRWYPAGGPLDPEQLGVMYGDLAVRMVAARTA